MNKHLLKLLSRYMKPADADGDLGGAGGTAAVTDRGDDFNPSEADIADALEAGTMTQEEADAEREKLGLPAPKAKTAPAKEAAKEEVKEGEAEEGDPAEVKGKKDTRIPLNRHTEILNRERALREQAEEKLALAQKGQAVSKVNEALQAKEAKIEAMEDEMQELIAEGKTKEAAAKMREIRTAERAVIEEKATYANQAATELAVEQVRYDSVVERLETAYPQIKPGSEEFDREVVGEIMEMARAFELAGATPSKALQRAVGYVIKPETTKQEDATKVTPRVTADAAAAAKAEREKEARKRAVATDNAQPAALGKAGGNSDQAGGQLDAAKAIKLSHDQFMKLSDEDISRMRGDIV